MLRNATMLPGHIISMSRETKCKVLNIILSTTKL